MSESTMVSEFSSDDIVAMRALLARVVRGEDEKANIEEQRKALDAQYLEAERKRSAAYMAFSAFGFLTADKDIWSKVRSAMGEEAWQEAFVLGGRTKASDAEADKEVHGSDESSEEQVGGDNAAPGSSASSDGAPADTVQEGMPTIRELVISQLVAAGDLGTKAAAIRQYISQTYGHTVHDKTVGMTLYRLSKEGTARREGRTWFISAPNDAHDSTSASEDEAGDEL